MKRLKDTKTLQRAMLFTGFVLSLAIVRWAWLARITHDEGENFGLLYNFTQTWLIQPMIDGIWGTRAFGSTGPTLILPLGLLAHVISFDVIPFYRLCVFAVFGALFYLASRAAGLNRATIGMTWAFFLFWVMCMPCEPVMNPASINLISSMFAEGWGFGFALLAIVAASRREAKWRNLFWIFAVLAAGAKSVAALAVAFPALFIFYEALKKKDWRALGLPGIAGGIALMAAWQLWQIAVVGWDEQLRDWQAFFYWLDVGGGYSKSVLDTVFSKFDQLRKSRVNPYIVTAVWTIGAMVWLWLQDQVFSKRLLKIIGGSLGLYLFWYIFFAGRGWMRHLWMAYALFGWLVSASIAVHIERHPRKKAISLALLVSLAIIGVAHGALGLVFSPYDEDSRWRTQKEFAEELGEKYPNARLFVYDWHFVPTPAIFLRMPQIDVRTTRIQHGDLLLCDEESDCHPRTFSRLGLCIPKIERAHVGYCLY